MSKFYGEQLLLTNRFRMFFSGVHPRKTEKWSKNSANKNGEYVAKQGFSWDRKIFAARV